MAIRLIWVLLCMTPTVFAGPDIVDWQTSRGSKVYFVESKELPIVDLKIIFAAGSVRDPAEKGGLARMTNSLLDEGAGGLSANDVSYEFERLGAIYAADAAYDSSSVSLRSLSDKEILQPALNNLARVISSPDFLEKAVARQKKRFLAELQARKQSPAALARENFLATIYAGHPYAKSGEGTEESLQALNKADIESFHRQYYTAANALIAIVGDLSRAEAERIAEALTQDLPRGKAAAPIAEVNLLKEGKEVRIQHPSSQVHILLGQPAIARDSEDYFPLYVGNHILGGSGMVSRLFEEIRNKRGLSYGAYSYFAPRRHKGPFIAGLQTKGEQQDESLQILREMIAEYTKTGPTEAELNAAKLNITGGFPLRLDSNGKILNYVAAIGFHGLPLDYLDNYINNINAVTIEQIKAAFARHVTPDKLVAVLVGPVHTAPEDDKAREARTE